MAANSHSLDLELSSSQYASIADASQTGLDLSGDFTLEFWVKPETLADFQTVLSKGDEGAGDKAYRIQTQASGVLTVEINQTADNTTRDLCNFASGTLANGIWKHIAITCDISQASASTFELFVNGVSQGNGTMAVSGNCASINNSTQPFYIGAREQSGSPDRFFDGKIDEVRVWNDIRTSTEIQTNYQKHLAGNEANLVGYWRLNNNYLDETSNNNDLTASGSPVFSTDVPFTVPDSGGNPMFFSTGGNTLG